MNIFLVRISNIYNIIMYLFHVTEFKYLKSILKDNELKASKFTNNISQGYGIYEPNEMSYVFLGTTDKLYDNQIMGNVVIYLKSDLLYNRSYYIDKCHNISIINSKKIVRYNKNYNKILNNLYKHSNKKNKDLFYIYQQIAIKDKINLKDNIIGIQFQHPNDKLKEYITKNYNIEIFDNPKYI